jgi:hypothetical protein
MFEKGGKDFETLLTIFLLTWKGKAQKQNKKKS